MKLDLKNLKGKMIRGLKNLSVLRHKFGRIQQNILRRNLSTLEDIVVPSPYQSLAVPTQTIDQYVWESVEKWSTKTAMESLYGIFIMAPLHTY